jgi:hypothetical protein
MATQVLGGLRARLADSAFSGDPSTVCDAELSQPLSPDFSQEGEYAVISARAGLRGARAALIAISFEAVAALGIYALWRLVHLIRA